MGYSQNSLTSSIYEMALGRSNWDSILDILHAAFPECLVLVTGLALGRRASLLFAHRGLNPDAVGAYLSTYADQNPWLDGVADLAPFQVYHDDQLLPRDEARHSPYVTNWLAKQGDFGASTGVVILREGARQMAIEIRYSASNVAVRERASTVLSEAAYHLGRAFEIVKRTRFSSGFGY